MLNVYHAIGNVLAIMKTHYMLYTFDPATAELADAKDELHSVSSVTVEKTEAVLTTVADAIGNAFAIMETHYMLFTFDPAAAELADKNDKLRSASNMIAKKTETVYSSDEPSFKVEEAIAANNVIAEKSEAMVTVDSSAKEHESKVEGVTETQKHDVLLRKVVSPLAPKRKPIIHIRGGMYGNINNVLHRYDDPAGYYNEFTYNLDDELKRCGELVPNYYEFAIF
ncbi:hypothetical protein GGF49_001622 [Coemansia sp. RSA 1853]|nr:hypothetical protein LPJ76_002178 [Coemansia sp. RSA 638]KAJ2543980.1 hypothetical protein GGF49_001622 [Coemansia sp. RSA 1853]